jgi:hypothetical protein
MLGRLSVPGLAIHVGASSPTSAPRRRPPRRLARSSRTIGLAKDGRLMFGCLPHHQLLHQVAQLQEQVAHLQSVRSSDALKAQLDLERVQAARRESDLRRDSDVREARHVAELHELRRALTDAAVREERLRGELRAAAREMELRSMLGSPDAQTRQPHATSCAVPPPASRPAHTSRSASCALAAPSLAPAASEWSANASAQGEPAALPAAQLPAPADVHRVEANGAATTDGPRFAAFISHAKADAVCPRPAVHDHVTMP